MTFANVFPWLFGLGFTAWSFVLLIGARRHLRQATNLLASARQAVAEAEEWREKTQAVYLKAKKLYDDSRRPHYES